MVGPERALDAGGGVARRRDLLGSGVSRRGLDRAVAGGAVRWLAPHVLGRTSGVDEVALRTAVSALDAVASHQDAARLWGIELLEPALEVHVTVGRDRSRARHPGAVVHRAALTGDEVEERHGLRATSVVRTLLDLCRSLPLVEAVVAVDSALRQGLVHVSTLRAAHAARTRDRGRRTVTRVLALVDPQCGSVLESVFRVLVHLQGLPAPQTQLTIHVAGRPVARVDFAWPEQRLVVETDGFAFHADRQRYRDDRRRNNQLVLAGWRVLRFSWEDVLHHPERVIAAMRTALSLAA